ncbi:purine nucleoside phosphorylase I, inosine and guanosine-specific [Bacteriovorax sp. BSW11_IV]|uniref:purine-nucleoside phosphorylase n=1 Tax=Bacteriovorax sp. BSW11_IV TaxID=1353529 RepID=UPI000389F586|nr:purine-nucleoside phosphorylase [Bacteriovorax sp. BSW11_IV]EQC49066.1 purine nucleoside phosphorylase I, inosine and guanosine-specific [Bacteriovorax sp. BSW11_IV]
MSGKIQEAVKAIEAKMKNKPKVGIVLGSGLGDFVDAIENKTVISYDDIPHFGQTTVVGHSGQLILGTVKGVEVAVMQGRFHFYEGRTMEEVVLPVRTLAGLGIESIILTNAAGGINLSFTQGDLVCIEDQINFMGQNPLIGPNDESVGPRFPDMTYAYDPELRAILKDVAKNQGLDLKTGVYVGVLGPTYETPAEIRMFRTLGADMVGMSTVPECIAANHMGLKVCGISCVTNMAAGIEATKLMHEDIKEQALKIMQKFTNLLVDSVAKIGQLSK